MSEVVKVGQILTDKVIRQSDKNESDGLTFHNGLVIIVKDINLKRGQNKRADIKIERVREKFAFASIFLDDDPVE